MELQAVYIYDKLIGKVDAYTKIRYNDKGNPSIIEQTELHPMNLFA